MGLKAVLVNVDDLPEAQRLLYREEGEGDAKRFILDVEDAEGFSLNQPEKTTTKLALEAKHRREAEKKAAAAVKRVEDLEARLAELEENPPEKGGENGDARTKKMREKMLQEHEAEKNVLKTEITKLSGLLQHNVVEAQAIAAISAEGGSVKLLLPEILKRSRARVDGDRYVVEVMDEADPEALAFDGKGNPLSIPGLVTSLKSNPDYAPAFRGTAGNGSGAPAGGKPPGGGGGAGPRHRGDFRTSAEKAAWINANGMQAFSQLPKAPLKVA